MDYIGFYLWVITGMIIPCLLGGDYMYYTDKMKYTAKMGQSAKSFVCLCLGIGMAVISFSIFYLVYVVMGLG